MRPINSEGRRQWPESELGLLESFSGKGKIDDLHVFMHDFPVNLDVSTLDSYSHLGGNPLDWFGAG
ncbi:MAG: hypothetical protein OEM58_09830 [Nitrospirota bacterium]|nr:hypothetical protein [Nitrospirota bacterium]